MARLEVCEGCGRTFGCGVDDAACWCNDRDADAATVAALAAEFSRCLCPECLDARAGEARVSRLSHAARRRL